ncbi:hypothetical protein FA13DRAFT_1790944 [Coprinellus micaceus]|uniref:Uncharacterized protein n=1 Tax=Coprinellus micaceus TaxID=71717 RepID=A0A4Y7TD57_COPMI|nr:hypothetical protein FA13DRAFT_1790944 [Coprinellus micaceus]
MRYIDQRSLKEALEKENATGSLTNGQFGSQLKPPTMLAKHRLFCATSPRRPSTLPNNLCVARNDLGNTPGKPSIIQCKGCGAIIHLGPIDMGTNAFAEHLAMRHTAEECNNLELKGYDYGGEEDANEEDSGYGGVDEINNAGEESTLVVDISGGRSKD